MCTCAVTEETSGTKQRMCLQTLVCKMERWFKRASVWPGPVVANSPCAAFLAGRRFWERLMALEWRRQKGRLRSCVCHVQTCNVSCRRSGRRLYWSKPWCSRRATFSVVLVLPLLRRRVSVGSLLGVDGSAWSCCGAQVLLQAKAQGATYAARMCVFGAWAERRTMFGSMRRGSLWRYRNVWRSSRSRCSRRRAEPEAHCSVIEVRGWRECRIRSVKLLRRSTVRDKMIT